MKELILLFLFMPFTLSAEEFFSTGTTHASWWHDTDPGSSLRLGWEQDKDYPWLVNVSYHSSYYIVRNEQKYYTPAHMVLTGGRRIIDWNLNAKWKISLDFGLSITSKTSEINPTTVLFAEEFSVRYEQVSFGIKHTSNANLKLPNFGENTIFFTYYFLK